MICSPSFKTFKELAFGYWYDFYLKLTFIFLFPGFILEDQTFIDPKPFETLIQHSELSINFRLNTNHITCKGTDRQTVLLATIAYIRNCFTTITVTQQPYVWPILFHLLIVGLMI